ncbi:MAG TPA: tRNA 4-thiouridine(8) synthase ThiI [Candidatus Fusicatenibacter intestinigallinarum]|uniref:Probable tRNA sulfurtransferase n=1 Tax=Candidatus Fusicatenibacter intestinigallinarum TaxID=2838598 RepID=A0A9D2N9Y4_9FIRM|nr:tRNA 4-thiouridine(8) synthase ThiI [Candidatus Fusicatenibacter intestinigallinarum]
MFKAFLIKYAEIGIKGKNRHIFEEALCRQMRHALADVEGDFSVTREMGRIYVRTEGAFDYDGAVEALKRVFGIAGICPVVIVEDTGFEDLSKAVVEYVKEVYGDEEKTFKVCARRAKKTYPMSSMELNSELGGRILQACPNMKVDVHTPDVYLNVEIRQNIYLYSETIPGPGGMPVGTNGQAMLLLSGGIDSPVAGYMIAKRGVKIDAVYFHAPPYTSERAKQKVVDLARLVARYSGPIRLHVVNFTEIQLYIYEKCPHDELTIIMRRYMMKLAEMFARQDGCLGLITGESIGQVASQTMHSLAVTNEVCTMPVFRPLIGFDKQEIVDISEKIGTYETSVLPYEDCCTIFVAKHPVTKPNLNIIRRSETHLADKIDEMMETAFRTAELIEIS